MTDQGIAERLLQLKKNIPRNHTSAGAKHLTSRLQEYIRIVLTLPEEYEMMKQKQEKNFAALQLKVEEVQNPLSEYRVSKAAFKEAVQLLHIEIDNLLIAIK
jgi:hypothetical protein